MIELWQLNPHRLRSLFAAGCCDDETPTTPTTPTRKAAGGGAFRQILNDCQNWVVNIIPNGSKWFNVLSLPHDFALQLDQKKLDPVSPGNLDHLIPDRCIPPTMKP